MWQDINSEKYILLIGFLFLFYAFAFFYLGFLIYILADADFIRLYYDFDDATLKKQVLVLIF